MNWGFYDFDQMLIYKCSRYGKGLYILIERDTSYQNVTIQVSPLFDSSLPTAVRQG